MSYQELDQSSTILAHWFRDQGLHPGERVALHWSNSIEVAQLFFALFKAGLIAVPVNTRLKPPEIAYVFDHAQVRMCFSEPMLAPLAEQAGGRPIFTQLPRLEPADPPWPLLAATDPDQPAVVLYTSGTTARPKGVIHTHRSLSQITMTGVKMGELLGAAEVGLCVLPLMHGGALFNLLMCVYLGGSLVLLPRFDPVAVLDAIQAFHCTHLISMPAFWQFILEEQARQPRRVSSLKSAFVVGDSAPLALHERFGAIFGTPLREGYGLTESPPLTINPKGAVRPGSLGVPVAGVEVRLVDFDGREVPEGETGEVVARSPAACVGYWNDPEATHAAIQEGWLHTGDLACRDADGYYWFKGRKKEIIIRAGSNISPQEVEEALYRHPAVLEAGVVGAPDAVYGEIVMAFVVLREGQSVGSQEVRQVSRQYLADYKVPERIVFLETLPKSVAGKVHRRALKEMLLAQPELASGAAD